MSFGNSDCKMPQAKLRNGLFFVFCYFLFAEFLSWVTASWPGPCLIQRDHQECPTFIAGIILTTEMASDFIKHNDHDKVIVAAFTAVLALSTIGLWLATVSLQRTTNNLWRAGERQIAVAQQAPSSERSIVSPMKSARPYLSRAASAIGGRHFRATISSPLMVRTTRCPTYSTVSPHRVVVGSARIGIGAASITWSQSRSRSSFSRTCKRARHSMYFNQLARTGS
jgi:hypothetical protein